MMYRNNRIIYLNNLENIYYLNKKFLNYSPPIIIDKNYSFINNKNAAIISIVNENVINSILRHENPLVLVFASAKNPGGGVSRGSLAQEEEISLHSTWYFQLLENPNIIKNFYIDKGSSAINTDKMIYMNSYMLTDIYNQPITPYPVSFLGVASPNLKGMISQGIIKPEKDAYKAMTIRIRNIFNFAIQKRYQTLILGAWGCGVFGLEPVRVATIFRDEIKNSGYKGEIVFSILDKSMSKEFSKILLN